MPPPPGAGNTGTVRLEQIPVMGALVPAVEGGARPANTRPLGRALDDGFMATRVASGDGGVVEVSPRRSPIPLAANRAGRRDPAEDVVAVRRGVGEVSARGDPSRVHVVSGRSFTTR